MLTENLPGNWRPLLNNAHEFFQPRLCAHRKPGKKVKPVSVVLKQVCIICLFWAMLPSPFSPIVMSSVSFGGGLFEGDTHLKRWFLPRLPLTMQEVNKKILFDMTKQKLSSGAQGMWNVGWFIEVIFSFPASRSKLSFYPGSTSPCCAPLRWT